MNTIFKLKLLTIAFERPNGAHSSLLKDMTTNKYCKQGTNTGMISRHSGPSLILPIDEATNQYDPQ